MGCSCSGSSGGGSPGRSVTGAGAGGCSCSGSSGGSASPVTESGSTGWPGGGTGGGGIALEPFPRQTLVGNQAGAASFYSPIYDATQWKSIAWWYECYGLLTTTTAGILSPSTAYIETSESMDGPWNTLDSQAASGGQKFTGAVTDPGSLVRVRVAVQQEMFTTVAMRFVARPR